MLLTRLGAIDRQRNITRIGRAMSQLPVHPRLARLLVEGHAEGVPDEAALLAALLSERNPFFQPQAGTIRGPARATACIDRTRMSSIECRPCSISSSATSGTSRSESSTSVPPSSFAGPQSNFAVSCARSWGARRTREFEWTKPSRGLTDSLSRSAGESVATRVLTAESWLAQRIRLAPQSAVSQATVSVH